MCGIAGVYNSADPGADLAAASVMAQTLAARGPDMQGVKQQKNTVFAHRRLAIIDLNHSADQPLCDDSGNYMISFNGEIYNYRELRDELLQQNFHFVTSGDTEVILNLYKSGGVEALARLDGMFAFAIYDRITDELIMMRDPLGKKPLYYFTNQNSIIFASTVAALKKHPAWRGTISTSAVADFLAYNAVPGSRSIYENVCQLPPGSVARCTAAGAIKIRKYWQVDYSDKLNMSFNDASDILYNKIAAAVKKRLIADVPCGVFLSGGVDSAATSMLAARYAGKTIDAFTIGFDEKKYDERDLAAVTVSWINQRSDYGINHHCRVVDCRSFDKLKSLIAACGEPFADFSLLPTAFLSEFAAGKVKFVLSGDGADEIFGGYERYAAMRYCRKLDNCLPLALLRTLAMTAAAVLPDRGKKSRLSRLIRFLRLAAVPANRRYAAMMLQGTEEERRKLYGDRLQDELNYDCSTILNCILSEVTTCDADEKYAECDLHGYLADDILVKVDRASMAHSLEVRSPFLDKEVVEFAARLPFVFKQQGRERKIIQKSALAGLIAPAVAEGRKRGFAIPLGEWFRNEWYSLLCEHLLEGRLVKDNWMDRRALNDLICRHRGYRRDASELLGALLMLELFLEND